MQNICIDEKKAVPLRGNLRKCALKDGISVSK